MFELSTCGATSPCWMISVC